MLMHFVLQWINKKIYIASREYTLIYLFYELNEIGLKITNKRKLSSVGKVRHASAT